MTDSYTYLLIKAVVSLLFILGLIGLALYALRLYMSGWGRRRRAGAAASPVRVITSSFLGPKKNLTVVDVAGELIVLGITPTTVNYITKVERPEAVELLRELGRSRPGSFLKFFQ